MFKIGDFSRLSRVTVKTLRYYDEIGLLKPVKVDQFSGYRYYSAEQLPRLGYIILLKELGVALEDVARLLADGAPAVRVSELLRLKQGEARIRLEEEQRRLSRLEELLRQIEKEGNMSDYQVLTKKVEALKVASIRATIPTYGDVGMLYGELFGFLGMNKARIAGPSMAIYHDPEYKESDVDVEVAVPVKGEVASAGRVTMRELPAEDEVAYVVFQGGYDHFNQVYGTLMGWIEKNSRQITGPSREVYLHGPNDTQDPASYVTEVQFPVGKL
jgi:effector-binding domain-containing protein